MKYAIVTIALSAGIASQAIAFDGEYAINQQLAGFSSSAPGQGASPMQVGAFRGEFEINQQLAGFEGVVATQQPDTMRHAFRGEFDLNHGLPGYQPAGRADDMVVVPADRVGHVAFEGEGQINQRLAGFGTAS